MGFARESGLATGPPKEQPPRNLSGTPDRAGLIGTLESAFGSKSEGHRRGNLADARGKALRFRDRGGGANGSRVTGASVVSFGEAEGLA